MHINIDKIINLNYTNYFTSIINKNILYIFPHFTCHLGLLELGFGAQHIQSQNTLICHLLTC